MRTLLASLLVLGATPALADGFSLRSSDVSSYREVDPGVPQRGPVVADLVVPADQLALPFAVHVKNPDPERALYSAKVATEALIKAVHTQFPKAEVQLRGLTVQPESGHASYRGGVPSLLAVDGEVRVALAASGFWSRAALVAKLEHLARTQTLGNDPEKSGYVLAFSPTQARVAAPEAFRAELEKRLAARAREFAEAAAAKGHPLVPASCSVPGPVTQQVLSIEETALSLQASCTLAIAR